ncbi:hypothetical protein EVAR_67726_1 [Eumeta japonica]|uniref:Uncharacterized protein n=1 Tax=Eumeta variegata TaxID=151549 RepID=A0A4C1ZEU4_EUMVA|nr:hypothetical protein EVAR_67726_1 [Eumeta japonica]
MAIGVECPAAYQNPCNELKMDTVVFSPGFTRPYTPSRTTERASISRHTLWYNRLDAYYNDQCRKSYKVDYRNNVPYHAFFAGGQAEVIGHRRSDCETKFRSGCASADGVEERSLVPRSRSYARLRRNTTMSHGFSCVQAAFIDL